MNITIPKSEFLPHPQGTHQGRISDIEYREQVQTQFGIKDKLILEIESETAIMDSGVPHVIKRWFTVSSHPKAALREFREALASRRLISDEIDKLDPQAEFIGRKVGFTVIHNEGTEGQVFANIKNMWPVDLDGTDEAIVHGPNGGFPDAPEAAMAKVRETARTNRNADTEWLKKRIDEMGKSPLDLTAAEWKDLWTSVSQDIPI